MNGRIENAMLHSALPKKAREMAAEMKQGDPPIVASLSGGRKITITTPDLEFLEDMRMNEVDRLFRKSLSLSLSVFTEFNKGFSTLLFCIAAGLRQRRLRAQVFYAELVSGTGPLFSAERGETAGSTGGAF